MSALKGNQQKAISGEQKNSVQEETPAVSVTETISGDRQHNRPLLLQDSRRKMTEEDFRKEAPQEEGVHLERKVKDRARIA